jgi:hypothetical protein
MYDKADLARHRPTRANIQRELHLRLQLANPDDIVLVAFSGHGIHVNGVSYLCPTDANLDGSSSLVSINDVYSDMEKCVAGRKLLLIDACRDEVILKGFKSTQASKELALELTSPPRGLVVLSSCEPKQYSAEDPTIKQGVFMHYVVEALQGKADTESTISGNGDGKVTLDELYYYAHEKTKLHVARSHGIVQRPVMKGEIVGRFELAEVPTQNVVRSIVRRERKLPAAPPESLPAHSPLRDQADAYLREGNHLRAIDAYTAILEDPAAEADMKREARIGRGAAYIARRQQNDLDQALIDHIAAGLPGIQLTVRVPSANLLLKSVVQGKVKQNQTVLVTQITGDWLWVASVDGSDKLAGYLDKTAVATQTPVSPEPMVAATRSTIPYTGQPSHHPENCPTHESPRPYPPHSPTGESQHSSPLLRIGREVLHHQVQQRGGFPTPRW